MGFLPCGQNDIYREEFTLLDGVGFLQFFNFLGT
jgi:hypothetical protein